MRVPSGHDLVVKRESTDGYLHEKLPVDLTGAFDAALRQLKKLVEKQQDQVKTHPQQDNVTFLSIPDFLENFLDLLLTFSIEFFLIGRQGFQ